MWHSGASSVPKYSTTSCGGWLRFGDDHPARIVLVDHPAKVLEELMRGRQVLAVGALFLEEVREWRRRGSRRCPGPARTGRRRITASIDLGVLEVQVWLVAEEAVPEELPADRIEGPVGLLGVHEDDAGVLVLLVRVAPHVEVADTDRSGSLRDSWNHGCWSEVWFSGRSMMTRTPLACASATSRLKSLMVPNSSNTDV